MYKLRNICMLAATTLISGGAFGSPWETTSEADPLTDKNIKTASTSYSVGITRRSAVVRCNGNQFDVYFSFGEFLDDDRVHVRYRLDKLPLSEEEWHPSSDGTAVFADEASEISRLLIQGGVFIIEVDDFRGQPHRSTFELVGASESILPVMEQCRVPISSMSDKVPELRKVVALELEKWEPRHTIFVKQVLRKIGYYDGPENSDIEPLFALAVQRAYDEWITRCEDEEGSDQGVSCETYRVLSKGEMNPEMPSVFTIMYELAPKGLIEHEGNLPRQD